MCSVLLALLLLGSVTGQQYEYVDVVEVNTTRDMATGEVRYHQLFCWRFCDHCRRHHMAYRHSRFDGLPFESPVRLHGHWLVRISHAQDRTYHVLAGRFIESESVIDPELMAQQCECPVGGVVPLKIVRRW